MLIHWVYTALFFGCIFTHSTVYILSKTWLGLGCRVWSRMHSNYPRGWHTTFSYISLIVDREKWFILIYLKCLARRSSIVLTNQVMKNCIRIADDVAVTWLLLSVACALHNPHIHPPIHDTCLTSNDPTLWNTSNTALDANRGCLYLIRALGFRMW